MENPPFHARGHTPGLLRRIPMNPTTFPTDLPVAQVTALVAYLRGQGGG